MESCDENTSNLLRRNIRRNVRQGFAADLGCDETPRRDMAGERTNAGAGHILQDLRGLDLRVHVRQLEMNDIYALLMLHHRCHPAVIFLAEPQPEEIPAWISRRAQLNLPWMFDRRLRLVELHSPFNLLNRTTRLDFLIHCVFEQLNGPVFSDVLSLKTGLEFTYVERIYGVPYYSLWYGPVDELATNFVVLHTETPCYADEAVILAFMSWVNLARRRLGKRNRTVYGLATDSHDFWFYQINNEGEWTHTVLKPLHDWYYEDIAGMIGFIFHEAYLAAQETPNPRRDVTPRLQVAPLSYPDTDEFSFERLPRPPEWLDT